LSDNGREPLARISHQLSSRGRRGAVLSGVFNLRGAESYLTVRRAPRSEKTPLGAVHRRPQQEAGEICGLGRTIASDANVRRDVTAQRPALSKSAGLATPQPLLADGHRLPSQERRGARRNRRAPGRVVRWDVRPRQALALGADERFTGRRRSSDRRRFRRQSRHCNIKETICVYLRYLWALRWASDVAMASSLCVFVFAMSLSVFLSVSL